MLEIFNANTSTNTDIEAVGFIIALICLAKDRSIVWRTMILYLFITCVSELIGLHIKKRYLADTVHVHPNIWVYNILLIFQVVFVSIMFQSLLKKYINSKPVILAGLAVFSLFYIYEVFDHGVFVKHNLTTTITSVIFVLYSLYYFYHLLKDPGYIRLMYSADFWWVAGVLFFYFGSIVSVLFFQILARINPGVTITYPIYRILIIILYGSWSYSFICRKWLTTTSEA